MELESMHARTSFKQSILMLYESDLGYILSEKRESW